MKTKTFLQPRKNGKKSFLFIEITVFVLFSQNILTQKEVKSSFWKNRVISASFSLFGKSLYIMTWSFHIFVRCLELILKVSFRILVGIFLYEATFLSLRLLISLKICSGVTSEKWKSLLILIFCYYWKNTRVISKLLYCYFDWIFPMFCVC